MPLDPDPRAYNVVYPGSLQRGKDICKARNCRAYLNGWTTTIDEETSLGQAQAAYIRRDSRRRFTEEREPSGLITFTFEAGQQCFAAHFIQDEELFVIRPNLSGEPTLLRPDNWVDDMQNHLDKIETIKQRG